MVAREDIIQVLKSVIDPEVFLDVWTMGLIYNIDIQEDGKVKLTMTFTSVACPAGPQLVGEIKEKLAALPEITETEVEIVFQPPWQPSEDLKLMLGLL